MILKRRKIKSTAELLAFIERSLAKESGRLIIQYAQKRLGKIHYNLAKDDDNYSQELVSCQVKIHGKLLLDYCRLLLILLKSEDNSFSPEMVNKLLAIHQRYVASAPSQTKVNTVIDIKDFDFDEYSLGEMANVTGKYLFELLPMTDNLIKSDVNIFQGQIRTVYIHFLERLRTRISPEELRELKIID